MFKFVDEYRNWIRESLQEIGDDVNDYFIAVLVVIEIISETTIFARLRSTLIFAASFVTFTAIAILIGKSPVQHPDAGLTVHEFTKKHGFNLQNESVKTEDGYILTMHRIKCPQNKTVCKQGPPILFLHGLFGSSADFIAAKNQSLAFQLANLGYDVWLGNNRGNTYSRKHTILEPDQGSTFWEFSFHEIGYFDLPAMIDHVLAKSGSDKLTYVGLSQACPAFMVMSALRPEYSEKIVLANLLAPVTAYATKSFIYKLWSTFNYAIRAFEDIRKLHRLPKDRCRHICITYLINQYGKLTIAKLHNDQSVNAQKWGLYFSGYFEFLGESNIETILLRYICMGPHKLGNYICLEYVLTYLVGLSSQKDYDVLPFFMSVTPAGCSAKQIEHLMQNMMLAKFAYFDYYEQNEKVYNQVTAPVYDITNVTTPMAIYFGKADILANVEGIYHQYKLLQNVALYYKVKSKNFNHMDFIYGRNLNKHLNNKVIETINVYNKRENLITGKLKV